MKTTFDFKSVKYCVNGTSDFSLTLAMRLWRAKFETIKHFKRDVITHSYLEELGAFVEENWDSIEPVTVQEALAQTNLEMRRVYFDCIGPAKLFQQLEPTLLDTKTIKKKRFRWSEKNEEYEHEFEDIYELYKIDGEKIFKDVVEGRSTRLNPVYAVRCWCTTTNREYWIYVPAEAAFNRKSTGINPWFQDQRHDDAPDAIAAIAWTIRIDITNPERIMRQGDIIVVKESENSQKTQQYHLSKKQYLELMYSET